MVILKLQALPCLEWLEAQISVQIFYFRGTACSLPYVGVVQRPALGRVYTQEFGVPFLGSLFSGIFVSLSGSPSYLGFYPLVAQDRKMVDFL